MYDHADWLEVKITTRGEVEPLPVWARPISKGKYILTPASPETPQINNPLVYGARPGNPFLMPVMASGKRPMAYGAQGLPEGLELDTRTGLITGRVPARRGFQGAADSGECPRESRTGDIAEIGPQIALTPPMGWNSWNCWGFSVDDAKVRDAARAMHENSWPTDGRMSISTTDGRRIRVRPTAGSSRTKNSRISKASATTSTPWDSNSASYSSPGPTTWRKLSGELPA